MSSALGGAVHPAFVLLCCTILLPIGSQPVRAQSDGLTLAEVYELAREQNPLIAAASALADASETMERSAGLPPDPVFQIGATNLRLPEFSADMPNSMAPAMMLMQTVPFPGKLSLGRRIAGQSTAIAEADAMETWWEVRAAVAKSFYDVYAADRQLEVMRNTLRLLEDFERVARAMYDAGSGRQSDVLRANVEVARMDSEIARMVAMREVGASRLNALLNRPADTPVPSPVLPELPRDTPDALTLRAWAEDTRPMLEAGRTGVDRAETRRNLAGKEIWPDFAIGLQYGQRERDTGGTARMGGVLVGINVPIFASARQLRLRDEAAAMQNMAEAQLTDMRAQVDAMIGVLLADLARARTLISLYRQEILPQAKANVESSFSSYRVGSVDFLTLVDAQLILDRYEEEYYELLAEYGSDISELEMTIGRELPMTRELLAEVQ